MTRNHQPNAERRSPRQPPPVPRTCRLTRNAADEGDVVHPEAGSASAAADSLLTAAAEKFQRCPVPGLREIQRGTAHQPSEGAVSAGTPEPDVGRCGLS